MTENSKRGVLIGSSFALAAALLNSSIGIFNEFSFKTGLSYDTIAFYKTFIALIFLSFGVTLNKKLRLSIIRMSKHWSKLLLLSFLGVFTLYYFETKAFSMANIPLTAFMIYVPGFASLFLGRVFLKERLPLKSIACFGVMLIGAYILLAGVQAPSFKWGLIFAFVGGLGYSLFIFFSRVFRFEDGFATLWWIFLFGSIMLAIPTYFDGGFYLPTQSIGFVISLAIVPTIGGFLMTILAAKHIGAGRIQLFETSDPLFATIFAAIIFSQTMSITSTVGAILIFLALVIMSVDIKTKSNAKVIIDT